jgi:UDP-GlcNAc:undecaprenyl-phosphate GlcNAc-1-phosphate transferase
MYSLFLLAVSSFLLGLLLTPLVRNVARQWGVVDLPTGERHVRKDPIPRMGGVAIVLAYAGACLVLQFSPLEGGDFIADALPSVLRLLPAIVVIFAVGLADDLRGLTAFQKLLGQSVAALLAVCAGLSMPGIGGLVLPVWLAAAATVFWLVGCANAFNLIDGVDGLAAGVGLFATITVLLAAVLHNNIPLAMATVPLAGGLLGFLRYNFNPATIFLGDCGSLLVGFMLGCFALLWSQKSATALGMTAPLMALAIPLLDTALAIGRRFLRNEPIHKADRGHIHHRLLDRGFTPRKVALLLYGAAALGAVFSILQSTLHNQAQGLVIILFCAIAWIGVQHLGYVEFGTAGRMFLDGAFRRQLSAHLSLLSFEQSVRSASSLEECWTILQEASKNLGCDEIRACLAGHSFENGRSTRHVPGEWRIHVLLRGGDFVELQRPLEPLGHVDGVAALANSLGTTLELKLAEFRETYRLAAHR